jgi:hypothetical protein
MKKDKSLLPVLIVTFYLIIYVFLLYEGSFLRIAFLMFSLSPVLLVWMVIRVLKRGRQSNRTFDNYFYDDMNF